MIEIRAATDADKSGILRLISAVFSPDHAALLDREWDWRWQRDPRLSRPGYQGVVAVWEEKIIGNVGFIPAALYAHGEPMDTIWAVDVAVHAGWMRQALKEQRAAEVSAGVRGRGRRSSLSADMFDHPAAPRMMLGKLGSDQMQVVLRKVGWEETEGSGYWVRDLSITPRIARTTGDLVAPVLGLLPNLFVRGIDRAPATVSVLEGAFDASFDTLWAECVRDYPGVCLRNAAVLNWRYRDHPFKSYTTIVDRNDGALRGYAVVNTFEKRRSLHGRVADLFTRRGDEAVARGLLAGALRELRRQGAARADCYLAEDTLVPTLRSLGFDRRSSKRSLFVRWAGPKRPLYVTAGDGDGG